MTQQQLVPLIRKQLLQVEDVRVVVRDQSTEGFTPQRGDPIDFSIQGDWKILPDVGRKIVDSMNYSLTKNNLPMLTDVDMDYRPGMPEVQVTPDRENLHYWACLFRALLKALAFLLAVNALEDLPTKAGAMMFVSASKNKSEPPR